MPRMCDSLDPQSGRAVASLISSLWTDLFRRTQDLEKLSLIPLQKRSPCDRFVWTISFDRAAPGFDQVRRRKDGSGGSAGARNVLAERRPYYLSSAKCTRTKWETAIRDTRKNELRRSMVFDESLLCRSEGYFHTGGRGAGGFRGLTFGSAKRNTADQAA